MVSKSGSKVVRYKANRTPSSMASEIEAALAEVE
jgi:glutathione peroxidase-family protein